MLLNEIFSKNQQCKLTLNQLFGSSVSPNKNIESPKHHNHLVVIVVLLFYFPKEPLEYF